ncbi:MULTISPECIES: DUF4136 domain-containing protein [Sphingomonas]|uniref:DUF4136 domain-containing protein n=1 Tax=Sphingomonas TaxID=13687 RepID=UPI001F075F5A|nr:MULTISPECIES: DUF4136 domain-containing protein [Sphingomonas]
MIKVKTAAAAVLLGASAIGLAGCATTLPTKVTRYSAMPAPAGQTFAVVPGMGAAARGGLEFQTFAQIAAQQLQARGYQQVANPAQAQLIVQLGYGVDRGHQIVREDPFGYSGVGYGGFGRFGGGFGIGFGRPFYSRFGYGYRDPFFYGWNDPFWAGAGIDVYTEYRSQLELDIRDRATNQALFDGRAQARSTSDELGRLVPSLIEAMFTGFPGRNGETVRISIPDRPRPR